MHGIAIALVVAAGFCSRAAPDLFECGEVTTVRCSGTLECATWGAVSAAVARGESNHDALLGLEPLAGPKIDREISGATASIQATHGGTLWAIPPLTENSHRRHFACFAPTGREADCQRALESLAPVLPGYKAPKGAVSNKTKDRLRAKIAKARGKQTKTTVSKDKKCTTTERGKVTTTDCSTSRLRVVEHATALEASQRTEAMTRSLRTMKMRAMMRQCAFLGAPSTCADMRAEGALRILQGFADVDGRFYSFQCEWTETRVGGDPSRIWPQACQGLELR